MGCDVRCSADEVEVFNFVFRGFVWTRHSQGHTAYVFVKSWSLSMAISISAKFSSFESGDMEFIQGNWLVVLFL